MKKALTLETIMADTLWVAKMTYGARYVGTYEELSSYGESEDCRDFDICANQPEHLRDFYDRYFSYCEENGWTIIPEYNNS